MRWSCGWVLVALVGCGVEEDWPAEIGVVPVDPGSTEEFGPGDPMRPPPGVPVLDADTFVPGQNALLFVIDSDPGVDVKFFLSTAGQGAGPCNGAGTVCLDLLSPMYMGEAPADATGYAELRLAIPATVPVGATYDLQAVMLGANAATTNVVTDVIAAPPPLSHAVDIQPIWDLQCVGCHSGPGPSGGMDLAYDAYPNIVDVPSNDIGTMDRIEPFDPGNSYIWHKINGTQIQVGGQGTQMPQGGPFLSQTELDRIEQWILQGALP